MRRIAFNLSLLFLTVLFPVAAQKKRVAVLDFDYGTVKSSVAQIFGSDQDVGKGIADIPVSYTHLQGEICSLGQAEACPTNGPYFKWWGMR